MQRQANALTRDSSRKINAEKLTLLKRKIGQSSSMHTRIKENRARLKDEIKSSVAETRSRLDSLPLDRKSMNDKSMSRIVLPKIRDSGAHKFENNPNFNNLSLIHERQLPNLSNIGKNLNEASTKERYIKYKSLLKRQKLETDRHAHHENGIRIQSSSSSQNMSVQEMMLDKVYGTIDKDSKNYLS
jgi:hypothetical protein